jgi:repressor LexA
LKSVIRELRNKRELTQREFAKLINLAPSTIAMYETGKRKPDSDTLQVIADFFGVTTDYLLGRESTSKKKGVKIPVLGTISAGIPIEAIEDIDSEEWEEIDEEMAATGEFYALTIQGDSMEPRFTEGDVVIVRKQEDIESGEIGVVIVNGSDATVKKVMKEDNGIMLVATNNNVYTPRFYNEEQIRALPVRIIGKVVELRAKF